mgnify:CR=1 FL=1
MGGINSVTTIIIHNREASNDPFVYNKILQSEALFFAGGDQWTYYSLWKDTAVEKGVMALHERKTPIGGTR